MQIHSWMFKLIPGQPVINLDNSDVDYVYDIWNKIDLLKATSFQKLVWRYVSCIPRGQTRTYKQIAFNIGRKNSYRSVGSAVGKNPLAPEVPCHRVLPSSGKLGNYSAEGGVDEKRKLLQKEGINI